MYFFKTNACVEPTFTGLILFRIEMPLSSTSAPIEEFKKEEDVLGMSSKDKIISWFDCKALFNTIYKA